MTADHVLVERSFDVRCSVDEAWRALADVTTWPDWAPHISRIRATPDGPLGAGSAGELRFRPVGRSRFEMTAFDPPRSWTWSGRALGVPIDYEHRFEPIDDELTRLRWVVRTARPGPRATVFAAVYRRLIDRAWPRFAESISHPGDGPV